MKQMRILLLALVLIAPVALVAQEPDIVVRAETNRAEIERILNADNLDTARLSPREIVDIMSTIGRGRAPEDFWDAYQLHVRAWANLADAADRIQRRPDGSAFVEDPDQLEAAEAAIGTTFDEVERIARVYHARLPRPLIDTRTIA
jgi:hypothetical protein